jgi:hypothetical protein
MTAFASLVVGRERDNRVFVPGAGPNGGEFFLPWQQLRERFAQRGVELNTPDRNAGRKVAFELHLNAQRRVPQDVPCYAFLYEDPLVRPLNAKLEHLHRYRKVFTWNEDQIDGQRFLRLEYPNDLTLAEVPGFDARDLFCVMLASNKALRHPSPRNLHGKRVETIRFFEAEAPALFSLYGRGWHIPAVRPGAFGRLAKRLDEWRAKLGPTARPPFPSWRGAVDKKADVLRRARFAICYENSRGSPGYLTEKIFDCFTSGCVPVYIGSPRGTEHIPSACYIDGDRFGSMRELLTTLQAVDRPAFEARQRAIREFLAGPQSERYRNAHWCRVLVDTITQDLGLAR